MRKTACIAFIIVVIFIALAEMSFPFVGRGGGYTLIASTIGVTGGRNASGGGYNVTFTSETAFIHNTTNAAQNFSLGYIHMMDDSLASLIKTLLARESNRSLSAVWLADSFGRYNLTFTAPSTAGTYIIKINATWAETISGEALTTLNIRNAQTISLAAGGAFIIQNASGGNLAVIDAVGNMDIKGTLTQNQEPPTADYNEFIIQNSSGGLNLVITNPEGNLLIKNVLTQNQPSLSPTLRSFIIQNNTGATVAYVNSTGGLFLTGSLTESVLFS